MKHGAGIYKMAKKLGCRSEEIVDFSSNVNAYMQKSELRLSDEEIVRYADSTYSELKTTIAKRYSIKKSQMALFNGATSAISELLRALDAEDVYLYAPLYGEYEVSAKEANKRVHKINRFNELYKKPKKSSIVVFVNPSTPDGKYYELKKLFKLWRERECSIILDESFLEFEALKSYRDEIRSYKKLYIVQSFTKFYACAGVRVGAIFTHKKSIKKLYRPLWNLSAFDVAFLNERLKDDAFIEKSLQTHKENKNELYKILKNSGLFSEIYKSDTNFFLVKSPRAKEIYEKLYRAGVLVRTCGSFDFLSDEYLRFGVKDKMMHSKLQKALKLIV